MAVTIDRPPGRLPTGTILTGLSSRARVRCTKKRSGTEQSERRDAASAATAPRPRSRRSRSSRRQGAFLGRPSASRIRGTRWRLVRDWSSLSVAVLEALRPHWSRSGPPNRAGRYALGEGIPASGHLAFDTRELLRRLLLGLDAGEQLPALLSLPDASTKSYLAKNSAQNAFRVDDRCHEPTSHHEADSSMDGRWRKRLSQPRAKSQ